MRAVIPCFNRPADAALLLADLARLQIPPRTALSVLLVDNASARPLAELESPPGLALEHLRLDENRGGSGGFNAGMARVLTTGIPCDAGELIWLLDSDVRVEPGALAPLLAALDADEDLVAVASTLCDPASGEPFEAGGFVDRRTGEYIQPPPPPGGLVECEYAAACSLLVRRDAVERAGPMRDVFLSGDDVEWCVRLVRATGGRLAAVPASRVRYPRPDRMRTGARYFGARNPFTAMIALGCGFRARLRRALREVGRALSQAMVGRDDLAELHLRGLEDAAAGRVTGPMPRDLGIEAPAPLAALGPRVREVLAGRPVRRVTMGTGLGVDEAAVAAQLRLLAVEPRRRREEPGPAWGAGAVARALGRLITGAPADLAVVSARARPADWLAGRTIVTVWPEGCVVRRVSRTGRIRAAARLLIRGLRVSWRLARNPAIPAPPPAWNRPSPRLGTLAVIVLSHNRWSALEQTLEALGADPSCRDEHRRPRVIVVDNASADGSPARVRARFPGAALIELDRNVGVDAYNQGVARADSDYVLILDDDARPEPAALAGALALLDRRPDLAAVTLHPRHPATGRSEWPFAARAEPADDWPLMGCANLVRRDAWLAAGGYEPAFFLYRNDADLAMKLRAAGWGVHFNPAWTVLHDSPAAARKSPRWFELATRNWIWLCRRHGRGLSGLAGALAGWVWAHRLAGRSLPLHARALRGAAAGIFRAAPPLPFGFSPDGSVFRRLLSLRRASRA